LLVLSESNPSGSQIGKGKQTKDKETMFKTPLPLRISVQLLINMFADVQQVAPSGQLRTIQLAAHSFIPSACLVARFGMVARFF
jgi:hypothetical protein